MEGQKAERPVSLRACLIRTGLKKQIFPVTEGQKYPFNTMEVSAI
jgi:hypothetical protein